MRPLYISLETFFALKIMWTFFVTYENPRQKNQIIKKFQPIAWRYIKSADFIIDVIAIAPFQALEIDGMESKFFFFKAIRIIVGFRAINVGSIMEFIKKIEQKRL